MLKIKSSKAVLLMFIYFVYTFVGGSSREPLTLKDMNPTAGRSFSPHDSMMIIPVRQSKEGNIYIDKLLVTKGKPGLRQIQGTWMQPGENNSPILSLMDECGKELYQTAFNFPAALTIPMSLENPGNGQPDVLPIIEPEIYLVVPYFEEAKFVDLYTPYSIAPEFSCAMEMLPLSYIQGAAVEEDKKNLPGNNPDISPVYAAKNFNILIIASGYTSGEMTTFNTNADDLKNYLLSKKPYSNYSANIVINKYGNTTSLNCACNCSGIERLMCCNSSKVISAAAASGYPFDEIIVIHNTGTYCGGGYREYNDAYKTNSYNTYCMVYSGSYYKSMALHELGHSFGNLCDEYSYTTEGYKYNPCVNCRADCSNWSSISSMCILGCDAKASYYRPENSIMITLSAEYYNTVSIQAPYSPDGLNMRLNYFTKTMGWVPVIELNKSALNCGASISGEVTGPQTVLISNTGGGVLHWGASDNASWLYLTPTSGTGDSDISVSVKPAGLAIGSYTGTILISDPNAANSPQAITVTLHVYDQGQTSAPFGEFRTPLDGISTYNSVPVTGWALDDIGVANVKIYNGGAYIGDALFVEGARPDVETAYPGYPNNYKAGWGYMLLTHFLPNGGNGTYTLFAKVTDMEGNEVTLGSTTITIDNAHAVKPFGAIDTPAQGGTASGEKFVNVGWALTPQPNSVPVDGSTIAVYIDGAVEGHPIYNVFRSDIATLFPGYANTNGAVGYYYLDTTKLTNGVHTIAWTVTDNAGNSDGIGSRYFSIRNSGASDQGAGEKGRAEARKSGRAEKDGPGRGSAAFSPCSPVFDSYSRSLTFDEIINVEIKELERVEINLSAEGVFEGYLIVGDQLRELPIGSTLDTDRGVFYWQPGPGFVGEYRLVFIGKEDQGQYTRKNVIVNIKPK